MQADSDSDDEVPLASRKRKSGAKKVKRENYDSSDEENVPKKVASPVFRVFRLLTTKFLYF